MLIEKGQRELFFKSSILQIISIQENDSSSTINFFKFIYNIGDPRMFFFLIMFLFNFVSR
jgi:hypothetical protein